ncbi:type I-C CRISPR-associated protein Cas7/Csd2 [Bifidobacterium callitrichos]|nr:type I-C CRISPR-associated protein Cas7/Csd2 [Bifidobacterium callitrichos]
METLTHRIDFVAVFTVENANPNGDPLNGNRPRTTTEGYGEISDVAIKRKIRNRLQDMGERIYVQSAERADDGANSLKDRWETFIKALSQTERKSAAPSELARMACEQWIDVRSFGQVVAIKGKKDNGDGVSIGIRGPVTIQSAYSTVPVTVEDIQITKSVNGDNTEDGRKSSDTMGMKHRIAGKVVYVTRGGISPQLAERTGFTDNDAEKIKEALRTLFDNDESSARPAGSMSVNEIVWFEHENKTGQYSSHKVHDAVKVLDNGQIKVETDDITGLSYQIIAG